MSSERLKIIISGTPTECSLKQIKKEVASLLENGEDAVKAVKKSRTADGTVILGKFIVQLVRLEGICQL